MTNGRYSAVIDLNTYSREYVPNHLITLDRDLIRIEGYRNNDLKISLYC